MPSAHVVLSFKLESLFTVCLQISPSLQSLFVTLLLHQCNTAQQSRGGVDAEWQRCFNMGK